MSTEVEIRGPLQPGEYHRTLSVLKRDGKFLKKAWQKAIFFKVKKDNFSLKKDHEQEKFVLKYGDWKKGSRREVEVFLQKGNFEKALEVFKWLGLTKGHIAPALRQDFLYHGVQVSLKTRSVIGPHFEIETTVSSAHKAGKMEKKLLKVAQGLGLKVWTEDEYHQHTRARWEAPHPGPQDL